MKKILTFFIMMIACVSLCSCNFLEGIFGGENNSNENIDLSYSKIEKVEENSKPLFSAYSKIENESKTGYYKFYYFNLGEVRGIPVQMGRIYEYSNGVPIIVSYTSEKTSETSVQESIEKGIAASTEYSIQKGKSIVKGNQNSMTGTYEYSLANTDKWHVEGSLTLGTEAEAGAFFAKAKAKAEITVGGGYEYNKTKTEVWGKEFSNTNSVESANSVEKTSSSTQETSITNATTTCNTYIESNSVTESFTLDNVKEGFYRYGLLALCDVYAILAIDTAKNEAYVTYNLYPLKEKFYYGIQYSKDMNFQESLSSKFSVDINEIIPYLNYDADNSLEIETYRVTFVTNGGSSISSKTVNAGNKVSKPTNPTRSGYTFVGWYKESSLINQYNFNDYVTRDMTLYAKWEENTTATPTPTPAKKYAVSFETNGGSYISSQSVESGKTASRPSDPTRSGYIFIGWYSNSSLTSTFDFNTKITKNTTIYAKWQVKENFDPNGVNHSLGNRTYYSNGLGFQATFINNTGVTIYGLKNVTIEIYVNGVLRASGYWSTLNIGTLANNSSKTMEITFGYNTIDVDWWDNNRGNVSMKTKMSYNVIR